MIPRGFMPIIAIFLMIQLTPAQVRAETIPCIVDESECFVSGSEIGVEDEDLQRPSDSASFSKERTEAQADFKGLLLSIVGVLGNRGFITAAIAVCVVTAVIGIISLGGYGRHNVRC